jgi:pimeloyl-ACP methyl ester carboxylesterase
MKWTTLEPRIVTLPQGTLTYREAGVGEPIVFIHGALVNGALWRKVIDPLSRDFRCIVPDLPLGSHSTPMNRDADLSPPGLARIIAGFIEALDLREVTIVGNNTGGALTQITLANHPQRLGRVALTNCDAYENFFPWSFRAFQVLGWVPGLTWLLSQAGKLHFVRGRIAASVSTQPHDDEVARGYLEPLADRGIRRDLGKVLRAVHSKHTLAAAKSFPTFTRPVLLAWGDKDRLFSRKDAVRLQNDFPDATLIDIPGSAAFVPEDRPEELARHIREFCGAPVAA